MSLQETGYRSNAPGPLPGDGAPVVGGIQLPDGHRVLPDPSSASDPSGAAQPVLWVSDNALPDLERWWGMLHWQFPATGLWPVVLDVLDGGGTRPWDTGELDPSTS